MYSTKDVRTEVLLVTPEQAKNLRSACAFERQRTLRPNNTARLRIEMDEGRFIPGTPIFMCVLPDKSMRIANGNHTLEAVAEHGSPVLLSFIYLMVPDLDTVASVYATFDLQLVRSWTDSLKAVGLDDAVKMAGKVAPAVGVIMSGFKYNPDDVRANKSRGARFRVMKEYRAAAEVISAALTETPMAHQRFATRAGVLAVALETARYQPSMAYEFWHGFAEDSGLLATDPRKVLLRYLRNNPVRGGSNTRNLQSKAAAIAWNAHFDGRSIEYVKPGAVGQFRLAGTPWGAKGNTPHPVPAEAAHFNGLFRTGTRATADGDLPVVEFAG